MFHASKFKRKHRIRLLQRDSEGGRTRAMRRVGMTRGA